MNLDIRTGIQTAFLISLFFGLLFLFLGYRTVRNGSKLPYFRKRREMLVRGWRTIFAAFTIGILALMINSFAEPVAYHFLPPSPTITLTPSVTITFTISPTPTITQPPTITNTPSITNTPAIPPQIIQEFQSTTTPLAVPVFSAVRFARELDDAYQPVDPAESFENPITKLYGTFSYDQMTANAQWSALWYRNGELVYYETLPWNGGTGGYGYTEWEPPSEAWQPGEYEVQLFVGQEWIPGASGKFTVTGIPATSTASPIPTDTQTPTRTIGPSPTRTITLTPTPSLTPTVTNTRPPTSTIRPTRTPRPTDTRLPTFTASVTRTSTVTITRPPRTATVTPTP